MGDLPLVVGISIGALMGLSFRLSLIFKGSLEEVGVEGGLEECGIIWVRLFRGEMFRDEACTAV